MDIRSVMHLYQSVVRVCQCVVICLLFVLPLHAYTADRVSMRTRNKLQLELPLLGLNVGSEVFLRTFKQESQLELWMKPNNKKQFILFRTYPICFYSGGLGPKLRMGDKRTPEGFYSINLGQLNPYSRFHLSMNIGYPNQYDRAHGRTGSLLMIHGACDAVGCFAMGNDQIEEIYYLVEQALRKGQGSIDLHAYPFHLSSEKLMNVKDNQWYEFWQQLKPAYDLFQKTNIPPLVIVKNGRYSVGSNK